MKNNRNQRNGNPVQTRKLGVNRISIDTKTEKHEDTVFGAKS